MVKIIKKNGYVYLFEDINGNTTHFNLGKDPDSEMWKEEIEEINEKLNNKE